MEDTQRKKSKSGHKKIIKVPKSNLPHTPTSPKRDSKPLNQLLQRLEELTQSPTQLNKQTSKTLIKDKGKPESTSKKTKTKHKKTSPKLQTSGRDSNFDAQITDRLAQLAKPRKFVNVNTLLPKRNPYQISGTALNYKATPRIVSLAQPRERCITHKNVPN